MKILITIEDIQDNSVSAKMEIFPEVDLNNLTDEQMTTALFAGAKAMAAIANLDEEALASEA